ncbi:MAG: peptidase C45 acyl-coenzyme A:6-aminopenicillanic acid acyl-transferase [Planctomycetaceae bacterium]|nr:peptidase C45 acyl-coenzyme A:6-aminopenicillanic acid acyl-transferase [Planctomycetaceae bacterium]
MLTNRFVPRISLVIAITVAAMFSGFNATVAVAENHWVSLTSRLQPVHAYLNQKQSTFNISGQFDVPIDGQSQHIDFSLSKLGPQSFDFSCTHTDYSLVIQRRKDVTVFELPHHKVRFVGHGELSTEDHLAPQELLSRLFDEDSLASQAIPILRTAPSTWALLLKQFVDIEYQAQTKQWIIEDDISINISGDDSLPITLKFKGEKWNGEVTFSPGQNVKQEISHSAGYKTVKLDRDELERQLTRGVRRAAAVLAPSLKLTNPRQTPLKVEHGELRWVEGQRIALLWGTPEQIGSAHAKLLHDESIRCMDSVLHAFGTVQTILTGRWFRHDLENAYSRLSPHIPEDHQRELIALADGLGWDRKLVQTLNVFPELFHCSGFAVFNSATKDGKLYHGRVLDYMTTIGLQDSCVTFVVAPKGKHAFANVGYGGFIGSVSGMNDQGISLGEMGGKGEGQWDGVPMATLMRRALEECKTLAEVQHLWSSSPRTCEYYYVFSDGKTNQAVGVAATPEKIEFVLPGTAHPLLGEGIPDAVVLSAGSRLKLLRERIQEKHGEIDVETAFWLMSRPVAMQSNLHNVLFVPADGILYVANADHKHPAAEMPYVKINLKALLQEIQSE